MDLTCYKCNHILTIEAGESISRQDQCEKCYSDLRVCKNCEFYDTASYNECKEPNADRITEKEKANFCSYFKPSSAEGSSAPSKDDLLKQAAALFKK